MRTALFVAFIYFSACGGQQEQDGRGQSDAMGDAGDAPVDPCSGKACGESCRSWRVNAEACDIQGQCNEANLAMCTCDPCSQGCDYLHLCDGGIDGAPPSDSGSFPGCTFVDSLDRSCANDVDCLLGVHQTDCCGNTKAIGFRSVERAHFDAFEPMCDRSYPACGCPEGPTSTDSGEMTIDQTSLHVGCISEGPMRRCRTYVAMRPPDTP